jgi:hypothetical protein
LTNVKLIFLPTNVTSQVQPLDQGIIHATKAHYWRCLVVLFMPEAANDPQNAGKSLKQLRPSFYQMMRWVQAAWTDDITTCSISNCWRKAGIVPDHWLQANALEGDDAAAAAAAPPRNEFLGGLLDSLEQEHLAWPADEELPQAPSGS